ncbi:hypothetical protein AVEN_105202-1 [Araneus ventricosus]|uniref:CCHC-type domain-containing protein n=1 Tax=Araneus ventricosus TaxID=182803 RepID=A0A4Y2Q601_ARAVE|nr:hypothetical protein AVEN_105202-1 [Araneus ventricosus]
MGSRNIVPDGEACPSNSPAKENNADARFFILSLKEGSFKSVSPIVIHKTILAMVGEVKTIKKCKNGKLLIETANDKQAALIVNLKKIGENEITVAPHYSLNQAKGVISESEFQYDTDSDIMEYLRSQNVSAVKRISVRKDGQYVPTKHLILTFNVPTLPKSVIIAYIDCPVRPYIPNPLRCYKCQKFGHSIQSCRGTETCARCAEVGHTSNTCTAAPLCANCKGDHPSYARSCPRWKDEKEIQAVRVRQNVSFVEARKIVADRTPKVGVSYASRAKSFVCTCGQRKPPNNTETLSQNSQQISKTLVNISESISPIKINKVQLPNIENNKINTSVKPSLPQNRSAIPKINQNLDSKTKMSNSQSKSLVQSNKLGESPGTPLPSTSGIKPKKKSEQFGKETKAAKKARILTQRQKDPKLKQALKKRSYSKGDFLTLAEKTNNENDVDMDKGYPTDDSDILTDNSEDTLPAPS